MNLEELTKEVGGNVFVKKSKVLSIAETGNGNIEVRVEIIDPSTVPVDRIDTWLVKMNDKNEVVCVLQPTRFDIVLNPKFCLRGTKFFPELKKITNAIVLDAVLNNVAEGDNLTVMHIMPATNPGKYC